MEFQPTRPLRGATDGTRHTVHSRRDISTHAPLAGRDYRLDGVEIACDISTHAPLAGRDAAMTLSIALMGNFNPRATCGARPADPGLSTKPVYFNPRATCGARPRSLITTIRMITNFNPRATCGARQQKCTNHYAHFCDNRQISDAFAQNAACQGILLLFDAGKPCGFWVRTAQVISARLCFAL